MRLTKKNNRATKKGKTDRNNERRVYATAIEPLKQGNINRDDGNK